MTKYKSYSRTELQYQLDAADPHNDADTVTAVQKEFARRDDVDLGIPTFLRVGHPDREEAIAKGKIRLAALPSSPKPKSPRLAPLAGVVGKGLAKIQDENTQARGQLAKLGYSKGFISRVSLKRARQVLEDIRTGKGAVREDQA
jgi:hypothetical protein